MLAAAHLCLMVLGRVYMPDTVMVTWKHSRHAQCLVMVVEVDAYKLHLSNTTVIGGEYRDPAKRAQSAFAGPALTQAVAFLVPKPRGALVLGLGTGTVAEFLRVSGIPTDVVERDQALVKTTRREFLYGVDEGASSRLILADPLELISSTLPVAAQRYHLVTAGPWDGPRADPSRLLHLDFIRSLKSGWLAIDGTLAFSVIGFCEGPHSGLAIRAARTLAEAFRHVRVFCEQPTASAADEAPRSILLLGSDAPLHVSPPAPHDDGCTPAPGIPCPRARHIHSTFEDWEPTALAHAAAGSEGEVLSNSSSWLELSAELEAVQAALLSSQRELLPEEGWRLVGHFLGEDAKGNHKADQDEASPVGWAESAAQQQVPRPWRDAGADEHEDGAFDDDDDDDDDGATVVGEIFTPKPKNIMGRPRVLHLRDGDWVPMPMDSWIKEGPYRRYADTGAGHGPSDGVSESDDY